MGIQKTLDVNSRDLIEFESDSATDLLHDFHLHYLFKSCLLQQYLDKIRSVSLEISRGVQYQFWQTVFISS